MIPSPGPEIRIRSADWTALDAPSVRKIASGSDGMPSRSEMNAATASRMNLTPFDSE